MSLGLFEGILRSVILNFFSLTNQGCQYFYSAIIPPILKKLSTALQGYLENYARRQYTCIMMQYLNGVYQNNFTKNFFFCI